MTTDLPDTHSTPTTAEPLALRSSDLLGPVVTERDRLRAVQAEAVMPLIGPLLEAWECSSQTCREELPELDKQLRRINRAMEDAGEGPNVADKRPDACGRSA